MLDFESFHAAPDQLVTYFFWAEDIGPDGQPRRESSDMFFAEVRPFEEIFRQGEQPPSGSAANEDQEGQDNARASDQLAELQKEIINGTWKLIRRETGAAPSPKLGRRRQSPARFAAHGDRAGGPAWGTVARRGLEVQPGAGDALDERCGKTPD